jgi:hypothetical protein
MNHVLARRPVAVEARVRANVQIFVGEHAPYAERLEALARVRLDEKSIARI